MHRIGVGGGMHGNGGDAEFLARAQHAQGDFAAIGYEYLVEHVVLTASGGWRVANGVSEPYSPFATRYSPYSIITSGSPNSTRWPSSPRIFVPVPPPRARIWFIVS